MTPHILNKRKVYNLDQWSRLCPEGPAEARPNSFSPVQSGQVYGDVFTPLSQLLTIRSTATAAMREIRKACNEGSACKRPYIIGISGSVAVGKSSFARDLKSVLSKSPAQPEVQLITTDSFIFSLRELNDKGILHRKGFPESYDNCAMLDFLNSICLKGKATTIPVYSHKHYDRVPGESISVCFPDIVILEGLNIFQIDEHSSANILDFLDFSIYIDEPKEMIKTWYEERFIHLKNTAFQDGNSHFEKYKDLSDEESRTVAADLWNRVNLVNLLENILPSRDRADLIIEKTVDHTVDLLKLRPTQPTD